MDSKTEVKTYQLLMLIATPKLAEAAADMFLKSALPIQYRLKAEGTASSEIMDTLGLGSIDKSVIISMVPKSFGDSMLYKLHSQLRLDAVNSGIAFTIPLTAASKLLFNMMNKTAEESEALGKRKGDGTMAETKYSLILSVVNRGFCSEVMEAAKSAGAGGGTVMHSRSIGSEEATAFWGLGIQEEKEIVLIIADSDKKADIMTAVSSKCGMQSDAKGIIMSLPIDSVMGI